ncbi:hypothetical protein M413DRAFT_447774 [Hebeloma cylindrosporum]|uniref:Uncharacterized protein n=1 Tax=Hebeloma cylindrosporum TaxID=76867 RepID=A0A0C2XLE2_HEBCY|nr:hypothetical protein M413DRAFT_447774 [Hebeloma cylindrosporum h7]
MSNFSARSAQVPIRVYAWGASGGAVKALTFFPDGKRVVTAGHDDDSTRIWDLQTGSEDGERLLGCHTAPTLSVAVSTNGKEIVTGGSDGQTVVWNAETRTRSKILHAGPPDTKTLCVAFNTTSPMLVASSGSDGVVRFWKLGPDEYSNPFKQLLIPDKSTVSSIAFAPGSRVNCIAVASYDKKVRIYDVYSGKGEVPLATFDAHALFVSSIAWFPGGQQLVCAGDKTMHIWDTRSNVQRVRSWTLVGHSKLVRTVAVSPDGRFIASGSNDGTVRLWNAVTGVQIGSPLSIEYPCFAGVDSVAFSSDGKVLLSVAKNEGYLWDMDYLEVEEGLKIMRRVIDDLVIDSAEGQTKMQDMFKDEIDKMRETYEQDLYDLRQELERVRIAEEERFGAFQAAHHTAMETQQEEFRALHKALQDAKHTQENQFSRERAAWEVQFQAVRSDLQALGRKQEILLEDAERAHARGLKEILGAQKKAEDAQEQQHKELKKGLQELMALAKKPSVTVPPNRFQGTN